MANLTSIQSVERRSLRIGKGANIVMAVAGILAALLSGADAPLLDGLYSGINFVSMLIATKVGQNVMRPSDVHRPFGYYADEAIYVTFRSISILGIIVFAGLAAVSKIVEYLAGKELPSINFGILVAYAGAMMVLCFGVAYVHYRYWEGSQRQSDILKAEMHAATIDGALSAGVGAGFGFSFLITNTPARTVLPILDAIIVLILVAVMFTPPFKIFLNALGEIAGKGAEPTLIVALEELLEPLASQYQTHITDIALTKLGRFHTGIIYLESPNPLTTTVIDELREDMMSAGESLVGLIELEIVLTGMPRLRRS